MADITTFWDAGNGRGDWALPSPGFSFVSDANGSPVLDDQGMAIGAVPVGAMGGSGLTSGNDLATAVLISIFTDAAAEPDDALSEGSPDPRGWWGDATIGSRLWLRMRAKQTAQTLLGAKSDIEAALTWLLADGVAAGVDVSTEWTRPGVMGCLIIVRRREGNTVAINFEWAWKER